jgi:N-formylglutamate deformylase
MIEPNSNIALIRSVPAGDRVPAVFDSPHSGVDYPADFEFSVPREMLRRAEDAFVDELYASAPARGAVLVAARFPRSYIDANRSLLDIDEALLAAPWPGPLARSRKTELGIGLVWRVLDNGDPIYARKLSVAEVMRRITLFHQPYQKAVKDAIDEAHAHFGTVWHVNCHSMPALSSQVSEEGPGKARADFVLGDRDGTTCSPEFTHFVRDSLAAMGYDVKVNDPYKGVELVRAFSDPAAGRHSLQVEVNRRLYMNESTREKSVDFDSLKRDIDSLVTGICTFAGARGSHACGHDHHHGHDHHDGHGHAHSHGEHGHKRGH